VTRHRKARIVEPQDMSIVRQLLSKHISMTKPKNGITVERSVFCGSDPSYINKGYRPARNRIEGTS
jgi:hypothetical protein